MTKETILDYLTSHKKEFQKKYQIDSIGLFGSCARDEANSDSDIDIFVKMKADFFKQIGLKQQIEEDLKKNVDIVREHSNIKPFLLKMIQKDIRYV